MEFSVTPRRRKVEFALLCGRPVRTSNDLDMAALTPTVRCAQTPSMTRGGRTRAEANLHLASFYSVRGSYHRALTSVNRAIALDRNNSLALAQRARIEYAAALSGAHYGLVGRRTPIVSIAGR